MLVYLLVNSLGSTTRTLPCRHDGNTFIQLVTWVKNDTWKIYVRVEASVKTIAARNKNTQEWFYPTRLWERNTALAALSLTLNQQRTHIM